MDSIFMSIASTLSCFNIGKSKDSEGRDVEPDIQYDPGFTMYVPGQRELRDAYGPPLTGTSSLSNAPSRLAPLRR